MSFLAVDPGNSGGLAFINSRDASIAGLYSMPTALSGSKGRVRYAIDGTALAQLVRDKKPVCAVLEGVAARPGQGIAGMFAFGRGMGVIEGVLAAYGIPYTYVAPVVWKRYHGLIKAPKEASLELARELYPEAKLNLRKHEGRAEALLIGIWKLEQWRGWEWESGKHRRNSSSRLGSRRRLFL